MKVYQNLKYVNMSEVKHQKVIPSRLRSDPAFLAELGQLACGLGYTEESVAFSSRAVAWYTLHQTVKHGQDRENPTPIFLSQQSMPI